MGEILNFPLNEYQYVTLDFLFEHIFIIYLHMCSFIGKPV